MRKSVTVSAVAMPRRPEAIRRGAATALWITLGLALFILALLLLKTGATGLAALLQRIRAGGPVNTLGLGWLLSYVSLSGSPAAATALSLLGGGVLSPLETFGMINGSRFGASFIVLFTGFVFYLRGIRGRGVVAMGVLSMITTATTYLPAMLLGVGVLQQGWLNGVRFGSSRGLVSLIDRTFDPLVAAVGARLPDLGIFALGFGCLLVSFQVFDRALPPLGSDVLETRWGRWLDRPFPMFLLGLGMTALTLSVSVSLSILVPLAGRGYVRRDQVVPYIMGANISTFVDTLFASLLLASSVGFTIVLVEMLCVATVSLVILAGLYRRYRDVLMEANRLITSTRWRFSIFVAFLALIPLALLLL